MTQHRVNRFGRVESGTVQLNRAGDTVRAVWESLPQRFQPISLDACAIMPNHVHALLSVQPPGLLHNVKRVLNWGD